MASHLLRHCSNPFWFGHWGCFIFCRVGHTFSECIKRTACIHVAQNSSQECMGTPYDAAIFYNPIHRRWNALFRLQLKIISFPSVMWVNSYAQRILTIHRFVCVYFVRWHATDMTEDSLGSSVSCLCDLMCERRRNKNEWMEEREKKTTPNGSVALRHSDCHTRAYIMRLYPY